MLYCMFYKVTTEECTIIFLLLINVLVKLISLSKILHNNRQYLAAVL